MDGRSGKSEISPSERRRMKHTARRSNSPVTAQSGVSNGGPGANQREKKPKKRKKRTINKACEACLRLAPALVGLAVLFIAANTRELCG